jgi:hypothetical protein
MAIAKNIVAKCAWGSIIILNLLYSTRGAGIASRNFGENSSTRNSPPLIALWIVCCILSVTSAVLYYRKKSVAKKVITAISLAFFLIFTVLFWSQW